MILTCPECSTKYMAKDDTIGPNGRSVHCARCETVWFVEGTDPDVLALKDNKTVLITPEPDSELEISRSPLFSNPAANPAASLSGDLAQNRDANPESAPIVPASTASVVGAHTLMRDKADAEKLSKRKRLIRLIWAAPLLLLIGAAVSGILKRQTIVEKYPKTATLFQSIGLDVKANGLDIRGLTSERLVIDGEAVLRVTGEIVNLTSQAKTSPLVQFRLENRSGEVLADWFIEPGSIPAGKTIPIETDYPAPPIDSIALRHRFVPEQ